MLHNTLSKEILKENLKKEGFKRHTLSFYRYVNISDPVAFRNELYSEWFTLNCFGRVYVAHEGINAQMSVPEHHINQFIFLLYEHSQLKNVPIKCAVEDTGKSFYKLIIKVKQRIVADGLDENSYNLSKVGHHLPPFDFHQALDNSESVVVDMRNRYESEIGKFRNAYIPEAATFKEAIQMVANTFKNEKHKKLLLYCTGGIRCEKASSYLIQNGFENVNQLDGGIINYAHYVKNENIASNFIGKNFVFDDRLGESVDNQIIATCHQCGQPCDTHTNCANTDCHMLFIQCNECAMKFECCCSFDCKNILSLPPEEKKKLRVANSVKYANSKIFNTIKKYSIYTNPI